MFLSHRLTKDFQNAEFIRTGKRDNTHKIEVDVTALTPEERALFIDDLPLRDNAWHTIHLTSWELKFFHLETLKPESPARPEIRALANEFDHPLSLDEFKAEYAKSKALKAELTAQLPALMATYEAERHSWLLAKQAETARIAEEKALKEQLEYQKIVTIEWRENGTAIHNLYRAVKAVANIPFDSRFTNWIRQVESVDMGLTSGYCFVGKHLHDQTVEVKREKAVFLVAGTTGSRKYQETLYRVVVMSPTTGQLELTDIATDNSDAGWALRIREAVDSLLNQ